MASILERLDDLIRGSLHRFVDRALEKNSLVLYDQDVRDMEAAIAHLEEATVTMFAAARANERRLAQHHQDVVELQQRLERSTAQGLEPTSERMMVAQAELDAKQGLITKTQAQIDRQKAQYETLVKQRAETDTIARTLTDVRPRLESLLITARAYRSVERVEMTLEGLRGLVGDPEVAAVANSIYERFNAAQVRLDLIQQTDDMEILAELERSEVEDQLARRRRRLGLETEPDIPDARPSEPEEAPSAPPEPEAPGPELTPEEPPGPVDAPTAPSAHVK